MAINDINLFCIFCHKQEPHSQDLLICSSCVQKLLKLDEEKMKSLYAIYTEKGYTEKSDLMEKLLMKGDEHVPEARKIRTNLVGETSLRTVRPSFNKVRA